MAFADAISQEGRFGARKLSYIVRGAKVGSGSHQAVARTAGLEKRRECQVMARPSRSAHRLGLYSQRALYVAIGLKRDDARKPAVVVIDCFLMNKGSHSGGCCGSK